MKLIDKDALVAEIKSLKKKNDAYNKPSHIADACYKEILSFINTLEVKEVDLEKEVELWMGYHADYDGYFNPLEFAEHLFELGLKAQKEE